jgi:ferrochelatase
MNHAPPLSTMTPPANAADAKPARRLRLAVVLFNLGGPDQPSSIKPFLLNLFRDPAILRVPFFIRPLLARIIATARVKPATENYAILGGRSPLLPLTEEQARLLEADLADDFDAHCVIAMRYWHPFATETVKAVAALKPDRIVLLPLYPHFSTTTSGSSLTDWRQAAASAGLAVETTTLCCYFEDRNYLEATAAIVRQAIVSARSQIGPEAPLRILFSAHGLPQVIVDRGDPYQHQIEKTAAAILRVLAEDRQRDPAEDDTVVCYQSRATPQKWLDPSIEREIERAAHDKVAVLVVPIAFVSDHSETLVELDVEYREVAEKMGVPAYFRAPAQNSDARFIAALAAMTRTAVRRGPGLCSFKGNGQCPRQFSDCPHRLAGRFETSPVEGVVVA